MAEINIIILTYFLLLCPGYYTGSKSDCNPFRLKDTAFSCIHSIFAATATAIKSQAYNFVTLTFKTQKNGVRGGDIGHKASSDPLL